MTTLKEIAQLCNVSMTTVSNVINGKGKTGEETKQKILKVIQESGYKPNAIAKSLRMKSSRSIAIIAEDLGQFTSPPIIESIMEYCEIYDYNVVIHNLRLYDRWQDRWYNDSSNYNSIVMPVIKNILSSQIAGVIYVAGHDRIIQTFDDLNLPFVMCYAHSKAPDISSVVIDDVSSAYEIVSYLIGKGHKRIGFVGGRIDNLHTANRLMGYQKALYENELFFDPSLCYYGDWSRESGYNGAKALLDKDITAIWGISDKMTGGIYDYLYEHNISIGKDISVAGFDNENISEFFRPSLTTTALPLREIGKRSAELLLDRIDNRYTAKAETISIPCKMIIRESVKTLN